MAITFADTYNMITYLTKSDASEGFDQIIDFLNASSIKKVEALEQDKVAQALEIIKLKQRVKKLKRKNKLKVSGLRRLRKGEIIANIDADEGVTLKDVADVEKTDEIEKDADDDELELAKLKEVVEVVTTTKLMTEVVTAGAATITAATTPITAATITAAPNKGKGIMVEEPKPLKKQAQIEQNEAYTKAQARKNMMIYLKNMARFKMDYFKGMSYDDIRSIFEKYFNSNVAFLEKTKEQLEEEESRALKRKSKSLEEKAAKKQKLDEEVKELKKHLQIVPNDDDDVYTEDTPLAHKTKNFSDDFLLTTFTYMFEKLDVEAQVWKNQRNVHGLAKVKSWRLLESCGVHIITFTTTQMILLVKRRCSLTRFTLDQMLNNVRLEVKEESEVSLELLRFVRQQQQEGFRPE
nr:hypothetical protein [Tanacetum cinerariifolium]